MTKAEKSERFHRWMTIQWLVHLPVVVGIYFVFPDVWEAMSILYLALVSIYANVVSHAGAMQASRSERKADPEDSY